MKALAMLAAVTAAAQIAQVNAALQMPTPDPTEATTRQQTSHGAGLPRDTSAARA
jgi:hypothetical protein